MSESHGIPMQRIGPLAGLPAVLASLGVRLAEVIDGLPVSEESFRPETELPISVISILLDRAAELTGEPGIGLLIARGHNHRTLGPLGQLMGCCATLGSALGTFVSFQMTNSTAAAAWLHPDGEEYAFGFGVYAPEIASSHLYDISVAIGFNLVRDLTNGQVAPVEILLSRPAPADPSPYRQFFRCPVRFNESQTCIVLPKRGMDYQLSGANAAEREQLLQAMRQRVAEDRPGYAGRVRHVLRPLLLAGAASHRQTAAHLNLHPRTMGRRLKAEGVTFEILKDEVRQAVAQELLARTGLAVSEIGASLGYGTPSAFVRAVRRWTGQSPTQFRKGIENT